MVSPLPLPRDLIIARAVTGGAGRSWHSNLLNLGWIRPSAVTFTSDTRDVTVFQIMGAILIAGIASAGLVLLFVALVQVVNAIKSRSARRECARVMRERYGWHRRL
jgi:hypothetical protein